MLALSNSPYLKYPRHHTSYIHHHSDILLTSYLTFMNTYTVTEPLKESQLSDVKISNASKGIGESAIVRESHVKYHSLKEGMIVMIGMMLLIVMLMMMIMVVMILLIVMLFMMKMVVMILLIVMLFMMKMVVVILLIVMLFMMKMVVIILLIVMLFMMKMVVITTIICW